MTGEITVQWCPNCKAWGQAKLIKREITGRSISSDVLEAINFSYYRKAHQCGSCNEGFVTLKPIPSPGGLHWKIIGDNIEPLTYSAPQLVD
jgi:hypothetical protein